MSTHVPSSAPARRLRVSRPIVAAAIAIAALLASALPVAAEAPFVASPYVGDSQALTVGADGALWSVQSVDPTVLRRTLPDADAARWLEQLAPCRSHRAATHSP